MIFVSHTDHMVHKKEHKNDIIFTNKVLKIKFYHVLLEKHCVDAIHFSLDHLRETNKQ